MCWKQSKNKFDRIMATLYYGSLASRVLFPFTFNMCQMSIRLKEYELKEYCFSRNIGGPLLFIGKSSRQTIYEQLYYVAPDIECVFLAVIINFQVFCDDSARNFEINEGIFIFCRPFNVCLTAGSSVVFLKFLCQSEISNGSQDMNILVMS